MQQGRHIIGRYGMHHLQGRAEHGKTVVATDPDIPLGILEDAIEFGRWSFKDLRPLRMVHIYQTDPV